MEPKEWASKAIALPGRVIGLGSEAAAASRLYARLTNRPHRTCKDVNEVAASCHDVVVCSTNELTAHLMYKLYVTGDPTGSPGLLFAASRESLEDLCFSQVAKFEAPRTPPRRIFIHPLLDYPVVERGIDLFLSGMQPMGVLLPHLSSRASILSIIGHSDGIDLPLSSRNYLCPFVDPLVLLPAADAKHSGPRCQVLGRCTKVPTLPEIQAAKDEGWILPLNILRADIGVIIGCSVVRLQDGVIDSSYSLAAGLLRQADFGAILATWRGEFTGGDGSELNAFVNDLCSGTMVGTAVASFNKSPIAIGYGINLCVLGDPCFSIRPNIAFKALPELKVPKRKEWPGHPSLSETELPERALLLDAVQRSLQENSVLDPVKGRALAARLSSSGSLTAGVEPLNSDPASIDIALLDFLSDAPWLIGFFPYFGRLDNSTEHNVCPVCSAPARSCTLRFPMHHAGSRHIIRCACCGDSLDIPSKWHLSLNLSRIDKGTFSVSGIPSGAHVMVCLLNLHGPLHQAYRWPNPESDDCEIHLSDNLPPLPLFCRVLIAKSLRVGSIGFRFRQLPDGTYKPTPRSSYQYDSDEFTLRTY